MKKLLLTLILVSLFISSASIAQETAQVSGKPVYTVYYGRDLPDLNYPKDAKVEEGNLVDARKEGYWIKYFEDGTSIKLKGEFENNRPNGKYFKYYKNGVLKEVGTFEHDVFVDSLKRYREDGSKEYVGFYNQEGKEDGVINYYYKSGQLEITYVAHDGKITDEKRFNEDGSVLDLSKVRETITIVETELSVKKIKAPSLKAEEMSSNFQMDGYNKILRGEFLYQEGIFSTGKLYDGKVYCYDQNNTLTKIEIYKEGFLHSYGQL